jgi:hypothetical protein
MFEHLKTNHRFVDIYVFDFIVKNSENEQILTEILQSNGMRFAKMPSLKSPYIKVTRDWDAYYKFLSRSFSNNNRHGERHRVRDLLKEISRYDKIDDFDDLEFEE